MYPFQSSFFFFFSPNSFRSTFSFFLFSYASFSCPPVTSVPTLLSQMSVVDPARGQVRVRSCIFRHNAAWGQALASSGVHGSRGSGGAVAIVAGAPLFESTLFANNSAHAGVRAPAFGGALSVAFSAASSVKGSTQCVNCTFTFNRACPNTCPPWSARDNPHYTQGGHGGALAVSAGSVRLTNCDLNHNRAYSSLLSPGLGGALFATGGGGMEGENSTFSWNVVVPPQPPKSRTMGPLEAKLMHKYTIPHEKANPHESYVFGSQVAVVGATGGSGANSPPPSSANFTGCGFWPSCRASQVLGLGDLSDAEAAAAAFDAGAAEGRREDWAALLGARGLAECFDLVAIGADLTLKGLDSPWDHNPTDSSDQRSNQSLHALVIALGGSHAEAAVGGTSSSGGKSGGSSASSSSESSDSSDIAATTPEVQAQGGPTATDGTAGATRPGRGKLVVDTSFPAGFGIWAVGALVQVVPQEPSGSSSNVYKNYDVDDDDHNTFNPEAEASTSTGSSTIMTGNDHVLGVLKLINATLETAVDLTIGTRGVLGLSGAALVSPYALNGGGSSNGDVSNEYSCNPSARYASGASKDDGFAAADEAYALNRTSSSSSPSHVPSDLPRCPLLRVRGSVKLGRTEPWVYVALSVHTLASLAGEAEEDYGWAPGYFMQDTWEWGSGGHFAQAFKAMAEDALSFRARNNDLPLAVAGVVLALDNQLADAAENGVGGLWGGRGSREVHLPPRLLQQVSLNDIWLNNAWLVLAKNAALFVWTEKLTIRSVPTANLTSSNFQPSENIVQGDDNSMVVLDGDLWLENYDPLRDRIGKLAACEVSGDDDEFDGSDNGTVVGNDDAYSDDEYSNSTAPYHLQVNCLLLSCIYSYTPFGFAQISAVIQDR